MIIIIIATEKTLNFIALEKSVSNKKCKQKCRRPLGLEIERLLQIELMS